MNKRPNAYVLAGLGVGGAVLLAVKNKQHLKNGQACSAQMKRFWKAGHPDPLDIQDNKMVDEGAMTSVHYFNEVRQ